MAKIMLCKSLMFSMNAIVFLAASFATSFVGADHPALPDATYELDVTLQRNRAIGAGFGQTFLGRTAILSVRVSSPEKYGISSIEHRERDGNSFWAAEFKNEDLPVEMVEYRAYNIHRDADHAVGFSGTLTTDSLSGQGQKVPVFDLAVADIHLQHHEKVWMDGSGLVIEPTVEGEFGETIGPNEGKTSEFTVITQWGGGARSQVGTVHLVPPKGVAIYTHDGSQRLAYTGGDGTTHICHPYTVPPEGAKTTIRIVANEHFFRDDEDDVIEAIFTWDSDIRAHEPSIAKDYMRVLSLPRLRIMDTPDAVFADAESDVPLFFEVHGADKVKVLQAFVSLEANAAIVINDQPIPLTHLIPGDAVSTFDGGNTDKSNGQMSEYTVIIDRSLELASFTSPGPRRIADQYVHYTLCVYFEYNGQEYVRMAAYPIQFVADKTVKAVQLGHQTTFAATDAALYHEGQHLCNFDGNSYVARNFAAGLHYCHPSPPNSYHWHESYSTYPHALGTLTDYWTTMERQVTGPSGEGAPDAKGFTMRAMLHRHSSHPNSSEYFTRTGVMGVERGAHFAVTYPRKTFSVSNVTYVVVDKRRINTASMTAHLFEDATVDLKVDAESATGWDGGKLSRGGIAIAAGTLAVYTAAGPVGWVLGAATITGGAIHLLDAVANPTVETVAYAGVYGVYAIHYPGGQSADDESWTPVYPGPPEGGGTNVRKANGSTPDLSAEVKVPDMTPVLFSGWHLGLRADVVAQAVPEYRMFSNQTALAEVEFKYPVAGLGSSNAVRITSSVGLQ